MNKKLNLIVENSPKKDDQIEIVERKGLGHPDTIFDLLVDYLSIRLSQIYKKEFGFIPHFNFNLLGYYSLTQLEKIVLTIERLINSQEFKKIFPETDEDVKIMGWRKNKKIYLIRAVAFIDKFIKSEDDYFIKKEKVRQAVLDFIEKKFEQKINFEINTLDKRGWGINGCYLTVTVTSADSGDSGEVGRGNRANGLIPLNRVTGSEAAAGKNYISHMGKIYNLLSFKLAREV